MLFLDRRAAVVILNRDLKIAVFLRGFDAPILQGRMALSNKAEESDRFHFHRLDAVAQMGGAAHLHQVKQAIGKVGLICALYADPLDHHTRRGLQDRGRYQCHEGRRRVQCNPENPIACVWIERVLWLQRPAQPAQDRHQIICKLHGHCRWLHSAADAYKQRIVKLRTQSPKRVADGRWCDIELFSRASDAAILHQRLEGRQKVEVDLV